MSPPAKKKRSRKSTKAKDSLSRQTSLWDAFGLKSSSSQKDTPSASAATSENESVGADDIIDICSSDAEPLSEEPSAVPASSSPDPTNAESSAATQPPASGSKDIPIIIIDSSPVHSPVAPRKAPPQAPPKPLYSIFAPRKRPEERSTSQKPAARGSSTSAAPYPDSITQHVRGQQQIFSAPAHPFPSRAAPSASPETPEAFDYSRLVQGPSHHIADGAEGHSLHPAAPSDASVKEDHSSNVPAVHRSYPAIRRFDEDKPDVANDASDPSSTTTLLWNDKWRPRRADQVLGNERSALYLRDWLLALKLHITASGDAPTPSPATSDTKRNQRSGKLAKGKAKGPRGTKRPRVVRDVQKKRRRVDSEEPDDSWIVDDSTEDEAHLDFVFESEGDFIPTKLSRLKRAETEESLGDPPSGQPDDTPHAEDPLPPSVDPVPAFSYSPPKFGDTLFNTILLAGPHGCGKTAAVYACAEELGWDVFEVYPGIGERSGAALNRLIGEVGKNHLVKQTQHQPKAESVNEAARPLRSKANFFTKRVFSDDEGESVRSLSASQEPQKEEPGDVKHETSALAPVVSQSIVLIEEADVLYKEDANFWPTLLKIIRDCRRPVVLTCNDTSLVPIGDLPLQTTLHFVPCPTPLVTSYLRALCIAEGRIVDGDAIARLYEGHAAYVEPQSEDTALHPDRILSQVPDLRRTINQLQSGVAAGAEPEGQTPRVIEHEGQSTEGLIRMARCIELSSFVDSGLRRPGEEVLRDLLSNSASPCADDQLGYKHLVASPPDTDSSLPITFSTYHYDEAILSTLLSSAQSAYPAPSDLQLASAPDPPHPLHAAYCGTMLPLLDRLRVPRDQLVRDAHAIFLDYEPWVRYMVRVDDARIAGSVASGTLEGSRRTRNSQRTQWALIRWLMLNEGELDVLRRTEFQLDDA
ncbi:hypothetical protein BV20DRAFT_962536 [Pilatotrama ljubarskyi]|nr:hypothetical protein BV20DRAFT_962536 [Pilatotrama ljubarskyi]